MNRIAARVAALCVWIGTVSAHGSTNALVVKTNLFVTGYVTASGSPITGRFVVVSGLLSGSNAVFGSTLFATGGVSTLGGLYAAGPITGSTFVATGTAPWTTTSTLWPWSSITNPPTLGTIAQRGSNDFQLAFTALPWSIITNPPATGAGNMTSNDFVTGNGIVSTAAVAQVLQGAGSLAYSNSITAGNISGGLPFISNTNGVSTNLHDYGSLTVAGVITGASAAVSGALVAGTLSSTNTADTNAFSGITRFKSTSGDANDWFISVGYGLTLYPAASVYYGWQFQNDGSIIVAAYNDSKFSLGSATARFGDFYNRQSLLSSNLIVGGHASISGTVSSASLNASGAITGASLRAASLTAPADLTLSCRTDTPTNSSLVLYSPAHGDSIGGFSLRGGAKYFPEYAVGTSTVVGMHAHRLATNDLYNDGGPIKIEGGYGGVASTGPVTAANGGNIIIDGGIGYGSGVDGDVLLAGLRGKVGIGTNLPAEKLHVMGHTLIESNLTVGMAITGASAVVTGTALAGGPVGTFSSAASNAPVLVVTNTGSPVAGQAIVAVGAQGTNVFSVNNIGQTTLGDIAPSGTSRLTIKGAGAGGGIFINDGGFGEALTLDPRGITFAGLGDIIHRGLHMGYYGDGSIANMYDVGDYGDSHPLINSSGTQTIFRIQGVLNQTGTATAVALMVNPSVSGLGSGGGYLLWLGTNTNAVVTATMRGDVSVASLSASGAITGLTFVGNGVGLTNCTPVIRPSFIAAILQTNGYVPAITSQIVCARLVHEVGSSGYSTNTGNWTPPAGELEFGCSFRCRDTIAQAKYIIMYLYKNGAPYVDLWDYHTVEANELPLLNPVYYFYNDSATNVYSIRLWPETTNTFHGDQNSRWWGRVIKAD